MSRDSRHAREIDAPMSDRADNSTRRALNSVDTLIYQGMTEEMVDESTIDEIA